MRFAGVTIVMYRVSRTVAFDFPVLSVLDLLRR